MYNLKNGAKLAILSHRLHGLTQINIKKQRKIDFSVSLFVLLHKQNAYLYENDCSVDRCRHVGGERSEDVP